MQSRAMFDQPKSVRGEHHAEIITLKSACRNQGRIVSMIREMIIGRCCIETILAQPLHCSGIFQPRP